MDIRRALWKASKLELLEVYRRAYAEFLQDEERKNTSHYAMEVHQSKLKFLQAELLEKGATADELAALEWKEEKELGLALLCIRSGKL